MPDPISPRTIREWEFLDSQALGCLVHLRIVTSARTLQKGPGGR